MFHIFLWLFLLTLFALFAWAYSVKHIERTKALEQLEEDRQTFSNEETNLYYNKDLYDSLDKFSMQLAASLFKLELAFSYHNQSERGMSGSGLAEEFANDYLDEYAQSVDELIRAL